MPTTPQQPARQAPQQQPPRQAQPQAAPPVNRPQGAYTPGYGEAPTGRATVAPAQTYPPGSRHQERMERDSTGPDPQESKLRSYELGATRAQEEPVRTVAQEQRERSEDMQEEGIERRKARLDERDPRDRPRSVAGVGRTQIDADEADRVARNRP
jgi:hypothetical protein